MRAVEKKNMALFEHDLGFIESEVAAIPQRVKNLNIQELFVLAEETRAEFCGVLLKTSVEDVVSSLELLMHDIFTDDKFAQLCALKSEGLRLVDYLQFGPLHVVKDFAKENLESLSGDKKVEVFTAFQAAMNNVIHDFSDATCLFNVLSYMYKHVYYMAKESGISMERYNLPNMLGN